MISICIPIYNFNVTSLVESLLEQIVLLNLPIEIILIDDCSDNKFKEQNETLGQRVNRYVKLETNIGRAAIRNRFLKYAKYNYLLFLDCDSVVYSKEFLKNYINAISFYPDQVICGGRIFSVKAPKRKYRLRWKYGIKVESKPYFIRNQNPNKSFISNNFLIPKHILEKVKFDERLSGYGHEDTLFGFQLKEKGHLIKHIDNPALNGDLESNINFLEKTETAIGNLVYILSFINDRDSFINYLILTKTYFKLKYMKLPFGFLFLIFKPVLELLLINGFANLQVFNFYKLGILNSKIIASESS